jgi:hypothetical protein
LKNWDPLFGSIIISALGCFNIVILLLSLNYQNGKSIRNVMFPVSGIIEKFKGGEFFAIEN